MGELVAELGLVNQFMQTLGFRQFLKDLQDEKESITRDTFQESPQSLGDILNREQRIGQSQIIDDHLIWFESWKESLEQLLREKQTVVTQN